MHNPVPRTSAVFRVKDVGRNVLSRSYTDDDILCNTHVPNPSSRFKAKKSDLVLDLAGTSWYLLPLFAAFFARTSPPVTCFFLLLVWDGLPPFIICSRNFLPSSNSASALRNKCTTRKSKTLIHFISYSSYLSFNLSATLLHWFVK